MRFATVSQVYVPEFWWVQTTESDIRSSPLVVSVSVIHLWRYTVVIPGLPVGWLHYYYTAVPSLSFSHPFDVVKYTNRSLRGRDVMVLVPPL